MSQQTLLTPYYLQDDEKMTESSDNFCQLHNFCVSHRNWTQTPCAYICEDADDIIQCEIKLFFKCHIGRVNEKYDAFRVYDKLHSFLISMFS